MPTPTPQLRKETFGRVLYAAIQRTPGRCARASARFSNARPERIAVQMIIVGNANAQNGNERVAGRIGRFVQKNFGGKVLGACDCGETEQKPAAARNRVILRDNFCGAIKLPAEISYSCITKYN